MNMNQWLSFYRRVRRSHKDLLLDHGTTDGKRNCGRTKSGGRCRQCEAKRFLRIIVGGKT